AFMLTVGSSLCRLVRGMNSLYQSNFGSPAWKVLHVEFVHKSTDQEYPSTGNFQKVFGGARICNFGNIETVTLVANANLKPVFINFKTQPYALTRVVLISMPDGIDHRFVQGHFNLVYRLLADPAVAATLCTISSATSRFLRSLSRV